MKRFILSLAAFFIANCSMASVEMMSYYFKENSTQLTESSLSDILSLKYSMAEKDIQFIEFNSFTEKVKDRTSGIQLSKNRADYLMNLLVVQEEPITINILGNKRVKLNFNPQNWNRIDIYYNVEDVVVELSQVTQINPFKQIFIESDEYTTSFNSTCSETTDTLYPEKSSDVKRTVDIMIGPKNLCSEPMALPILFEGGTSNITDETIEYVYDLSDTLSNNQDLNIHLRGHVCCGHKLSISRRRAKEVYKHLVKEGISKERMTYKGYSNSIPLVFPERTSRDRSVNRRVDVIFYTIDNDQIVDTYIQSEAR
jgi:outer membrane protein OmpA-like peptidoglycan-associated protein